LKIVLWTDQSTLYKAGNKFYYIKQTLSEETSSDKSS
jgi:hypothetical protein